MRVRFHKNADGEPHVHDHHVEVSAQEAIMKKKKAIPGRRTIRTPTTHFPKGSNQRRPHQRNRQVL